MTNKILRILISLGLLLSILTGCSKSVDARSVEEKLALANKYVLDQKYDEAILLFEEIIKIDEQLIKPYVGIAHVYLLEGKPDAAEKTLQNAINVVDDKTGIQVSLGNIYIEQQKYDLAEKSFLAIIAKDAKHQEAFEGLVEVYQSQMNVDKVIDILNLAIKNNPDNPMNYSLISTAYMQKGDKAKALEMVKTSLKINIDENFNVFDALDNIFDQNWGSLISEGDTLLEADSQDKVGAIFKFYGLFNTGEYQKALNFYQTVQEKLKNGRLLVNVALSYYRTGDKEKAQSVIDTIDLDNIKNQAHLIDLIHYYRETGDKDKAIQLAKKGLLFERKLGEFHLLLYQLTGDKRYMEWLDNLGNTLDKAYYARGLEYEKQRDWNNAVDNFTKAANLNPEVAEYFAKLGKAYNYLDQYPKAVENFDKALKIDSKLVKAYDGRAWSYNGMRQYEKAVIDSSKALQIDPNYYHSYNMRAWAFNSLEQYDKALDDANKGLSINSNYYHLYNMRAAAYDGLGQHEKAIEDRQMAVKLADD